MKKKGMKRALILALTVALAGGGAITSYADYVADNLETLNSLIDEKREYVEVTLPAQLEELENVTIPTLEEEVEEAREAYEKDLEENPHSVNGYLKLELDFKESDLRERRRDIDRIKSEIESEKYQLSELEKQLEQKTKMAYDPSYNTDYASSDELRAVNFAIVNIDNEWFLRGEYRRWNSLMGGSWAYNKGVNDDLDINFYIDDECVENSLSRAGEHDTETAYAWAVPCDLEYSTVYQIEINDIKFSVSTVGKNGPRRGGTGTSTGNTESTGYTEDEFEDTSTEQETTEGTTNTTATTDYPGYYDATLADEISNQVYYATDKDYGWIGTLEGYRFYAIDGNTRVSGWLFCDGKWYAFSNENYQLIKWVTVGGYRYYLNSGDDNKNWYMVTGWKEIDGKWHYFNTSGQMVANCVVDGYTIGSDGVWVQ